MADEVDQAQHQCDIFLQASLLRHQNSLKQAGELESAICQGCSYATKKSWGRSCDGWVECLEDYERRTK